MSNNWERLVESAFNDSYQGQYRAVFGDRHYGANEPLAPVTCRCPKPNLYIDGDGACRCWKCSAIRPG